MKKLLLPSMIAAAFLVACDDKPDVQATNQAADAAQKTEAVAKADIAPAEQAEQLFGEMTKASDQYYQTFLGSHPLLKSVKYEVVSYEKGQDSAKAVTKGTVNLTTEIEGKKSFDLSFNHDIKYDAATLAAGLIAKVDSKIVKPEGLNEEQSKFFTELDKHFSYITDIKKDQSINQVAELKAFSFNPDENDLERTLAFKGMSINSQTTIKNMTGGFGQFVFDFKGLSDTDNFVMEPTSIKGEYKENGDFMAKSTAPIIMKADDQSFNIESLSAKGNVKLNEKYDMMLGNGTYELKNIEVKSDEIPFPVSLKSAVVGFDVAINDKDIASQEVDIQLIPGEGLISQLSQGMVDASQADIHFAIDNVPASVLASYNDMMSELYDDLEPENIGEKTEALTDKLKSMFDDTKKQGANMDLNLGLVTADGNVVIGGKAKMKTDSPVTMEALENSSGSPEALLKLLDINVNASIPAALLERTGMQMMAGPFLQKNGDVYESKVTNENGQLLINGMPAPM